MDINNSIYKNAEEDIIAVRRCLDELIADKELSGILGGDFAEGLDVWKALISRRCDEPFTLVILGDFKRGKSTIINALLGRELAPVNVAPETYTINEISYGNPSIHAVLTNGDRIMLQKHQITREALEELIPTLDAPIDHLDIRDNADILTEIRIVDTPGLSDIEALDDQVNHYLMNADAIIYVASALLPFSESEQLYLASHIQPQRFGMLYVLVNMLDALSTKSDVEKIMARISQKSEAIIPNAFVYGISAQEEFKRKMGLAPLGKDFAEYYETEFLKFEVSLKRDIILQKDIIRKKRVLAMLDQMLKETHAKIHIFSDMSALDQKKFEERTSEFEQQCSTISAFLEAKKPDIHLNIVEMQQEAELWMYEFFAKLRESVLECRPTETDDDIAAEDVEKYFYSYLMDKVGEAYRTCLEIHSGRINELVEKISEQLAEKLGICDLSVVSQQNSVDRILSDVKKKVDHSVMNVAKTGTSETFPSGTMSSFKDILKKKKRTDIIDITLENYDDIRNNTVKDIKAAYQDLEAKSVARLEGIFNHQIEVGRNTFEQAKEMMGSFDNQTITVTLDKANKTIIGASKLLAKYRLPDN